MFDGLKEAGRSKARRGDPGPRMGLGTVFAGHPSMTLRIRWCNGRRSVRTDDAGAILLSLAGAAVAVALSWFIVRRARGWPKAIVARSHSFERDAGRQRRSGFAGADVRWRAVLDRAVAPLCLPWIWMLDRVRPLVIADWRSSARRRWSGRMSLAWILCRPGVRPTALAHPGRSTRGLLAPHSEAVYSPKNG